ncbi:MAG: 4'-phosphopantetheinyl transferase superfamily protein [Bacteroidetes bacterium]|nr:4'-phosphopantetheinyl transferase superfamily protein [Bacteroidota bacterium]
MPAVAHQIPLALHLWQVTEPLDHFADTLPARVRAGMDPGWHPARQLQYAAARWLLYRHIDPALELHTNERGAPSLPGSPWHLSISHSPGYVGVLLSQQGPVGLDLEQPSLPRNWETARIFMNPEELAHYREAPSPERFLTVWCAKEALYKVLNHQWQDISFKRELWTQPPYPADFPCALQGGMQRALQTDTRFGLHIDQPTPDLIVAALQSPAEQEGHNLQP